MKAGTSKIDITPQTNIWMDGMIREHKSEGIHDPLFARALVLSKDEDLTKACIVVSLEISGIAEEDANIIKNTINQKHGIKQDSIIIAATHTHSGPATVGYFNAKETEYVKQMCDKTIEAVKNAISNMKTVKAKCASGQETTISHYRRLLADDGTVIMNWEPFPPERIVKPLGQIDPEVGVLKIVEAENPNKILAILFNHAGHPNVLSGDNYLISSDYPGFACKLIEENFGCNSIFVNGAQGTMDIDGLKDRDWEGVVRTGTALANAVIETVDKIDCSKDTHLNVLSSKYKIPKRTITDKELQWAENILKQTGGKIQAMADGVGDDYKARLYKELHKADYTEVNVQQISFAINDTAFISFPGEAFTEIGMEIKSKSPFEHTYFIGLANGKLGYVPTRKAILEGGYAVDTRRLGNEAEEIIIEKSLELLNKIKEL